MGRDWGREIHRPVFPTQRKDGRKERQGRESGSQLEGTEGRGEDFRGTERTKLSRDGSHSPRRLNPFQLIPDRRELTAATTIVSSGISRRSNARLAVCNNSPASGRVTSVWKYCLEALSGNDCHRETFGIKKKKKQMFLAKAPSSVFARWKII